MKVLVFGGSFDPPHRAHLLLLKAALKRWRPDLAYVVPAGRSPFKARSRAPGAARKELLRFLLSKLPPRLSRRVRVLDWELRRKRVSYTYQTLREVRRRHPDAEIAFLTGADAFADMGAWKRAGELRRSYGWIVGRRRGAPRPRPRGRARTLLLPGTFPRVSSSEARVRLLTDQAPSALLPGRVLRAIDARGLYGRRAHDALRRGLEPKRYRHALLVARKAVELAERHGTDPETAALAGLLHDCGRLMAPQRMPAFARARRLRVPHLRAMARRRPGLLHAYVGAFLARDRFGVRDPIVLGAVRDHTFGGTRMSALGRLVAVADACSQDRDYPGVERIRRLAREDLPAAFLQVMRMKLEHVLRRGHWLHPLAATLWNRATGDAR